VSAEPIARVIADLCAGRVHNPLDDNPGLHKIALERVQGATVIDATAIYRSLADNPRPVYLYEDHPCIAPPWQNAAVCYANEHGNVLVMQSTATDFPEAGRRELWEPAEPVDWQRVRWAVDTCVWLGGHSKALGGAMVTAGPVHVWRSAVYEDGEPADLHWVRLLSEYPLENWEMAHIVLLGALNFMNCRNVELVEPARERHERKRLARLGVTVHTISVFPVGRSTRSARRDEPSGLGVPLTSVAGHFAHYGPEYGRGLLFGKLSGRYWIPQHARGSVEHGQAETDYRLVPNG
jgi:hypothetical protein